MSESQAGGGDYKKEQTKVWCWNQAPVPLIILWQAVSADEDISMEFFCPEKQGTKVLGHFSQLFTNNYFCFCW